MEQLIDAANLPHVILRFGAFLAWTYVTVSAPRLIDRDHPSGETRLRRLMAVRLVWGALLVIVIGSLAPYLVPSAWARIAYTAYATVALIVSGVYVWTYGRVR